MRSAARIPAGPRRQEKDLAARRTSVGRREGQASSLSLNEAYEALFGARSNASDGFEADDKEGM